MNRMTSTLAAALETYFRQSEQLDTALWLAADAGQAAGLLLQRLPGKVEDADAWGRVEHLAATITDAELLTLPGGEIIHRLFHEEDVRLFDAEPVSFRCSCSRERVAAVPIWQAAEKVPRALRATRTPPRAILSRSKMPHISSVRGRAIRSTGSHESHHGPFSATC